MKSDLEEKEEAIKSLKDELKDANELINTLKTRGNFIK